MPVWEVEGAEFSKSKVHTADGISIRFPRLAKQRDDKNWKSATSLSELVELVKASKPKGDDGGEEEDEEDNGDDAQSGSKKPEAKSNPVHKKLKKTIQEDDQVPSSPEPPAKKQKKISPPSSPVPAVKKQKKLSPPSSPLPVGKKGEINHQTGDVFAATKNLQNIVIAHCADDAGKWGSKGIFQKIQDTWPEVVEKYTSRKDLKAGDCLFTTIGENTFLATVVGQKIHHTSKVSSFQPPSFGLALTKLAALAKQEGVTSVYFIKPAPNIPNIDYPKMEKLLKDKLVKEGLITFLYEKTPGNKPQGGDSSKNKPSSKDKKSGGDSTTKLTTTDSKPPKKDKPTTQDLPDVFEGLTIYVHPSVPSAKELSRYIVAYGGIIEQPNSDTTHIVTVLEKLQDCADVLEENPNVKFVTNMWAWDCINSKAMRSEKEYRLQ